MISLLLSLGASLTAEEFWNGSPLFLNVTVIAAAAILLAAMLYFTIQYKINKKRQMEAIMGKSVTNQNQDFNPNDDHDPHRPMAIIVLHKDTEKCYAGPSELFQQLKHVTPEVVSTYSHFKRIDLFAEVDEE